MTAEKVRWLVKKDGTQILQEVGYYGWQDVETITEDEEKTQLAVDKINQDLYDQAIIDGLKDKTYTIGK